jgi:23S rRNA pseudouridine1911/1915/1917 synthase
MARPGSPPGGTRKPVRPPPPPPVDTAPHDSVPCEGIQEIEVTPDAADMRLDTWLSRLPGFPSRSRMQQLVKDGLVTIDGAPIGKSRVLEGGETIVIDWPPREDAWPRPENIPLDVIYEDSELLVINKQADLITHPAPGNPDGTLVNAVLHHCPDLPGIYGIKRPGIVHRLDKDTTGLIVVAKTETAMRSLAKQISEHTARRTYAAVVIGDPEWDAITVDAPIGRDEANRLKRAIDGAFSRNAISHFNVLRRAHHHTLIEARLETGRTHQIRVHISHIGHPILGDDTYGGHSQRSLERIRHATSAMRTMLSAFGRPMLHARRLEFVHPTLHRTFAFEAPLPEDAQTLFKMLWPDQEIPFMDRKVEGA